VGEDQQLDPRVIPLRKAIGAIVSAVLTAMAFVAVMSMWVSSGRSLLALLLLGVVWVAGSIGLFWHSQRWPAIDYRHTWYRVDDRGIEIRRGVFWRDVTNVPRSRVQHTDVSQGPLERRYGLATLVIYTAGTDHAKVTLDGLDHAVAMSIREHLMPEGGTDAV
jgi:uncharacterized protein